MRRAVGCFRVRRPRVGADAVDGREDGEPTRRVVPPCPRQAAWLPRRVDDAPASLRPDEQTYVACLCDQCPALGTARTLATQVATPCRTRDANGLAPWLEAAGETELRAFVTGIERDRDAVLAALCFRWSTGQVEGQVQRLKVVKRDMYGRAKSDLLRKRVLHAA